MHKTVFRVFFLHFMLEHISFRCSYVWKLYGALRIVQLRDPCAQLLNRRIRPFAWMCIFVQCIVSYSFMEFLEQHAWLFSLPQTTNFNIDGSPLVIHHSNDKKHRCALFKRFIIISFFFLFSSLFDFDLIKSEQKNS